MVYGFDGRLENCTVTFGSLLPKVLKNGVSSTPPPLIPTPRSMMSEHHC